MDLRDSIARSRPTTAVGFPHLFEAAASARASGLRDLRAIHVGGSRVTRELVLAVRALAPSARLEVVYGSTEIEPIASIAAEEYVAELGAAYPASGVCMGRPVPGLDVRAEPLCDGTADDLGHAVGSLSVRGRHAAAGDGAAGWVATGDAGWIDGDGRLWLLGRMANAVGGLHPFEVELAVERLAWVRRAALIRLDDAGIARAVVAVEIGDGTSLRPAECLRAIEALVKDRGWPIAGVILRRRLPVLRGPSAKVDTRTLARARAAPVTGRQSEPGVMGAVTTSRLNGASRCGPRHNHR